ncbi:hypothetical protein FACS1894152_5430 [Bacilli bacterium]|nr:hypothetical protein FACS1894152_5430 [Bacilli bacterium]
MKSNLDDNLVFNAIDHYKENNKNKHAFNVLIGGYVNGDIAMREMMEEDLKGIGDVLKVAKSVEAGVYGY